MQKAVKKEVTMTSVYVRFANRPMGMIGSAARRSTSTNTTSDASANPIGPATAVSVHVWPSMPFSVSPSRSALMATVKTAMPA